MPSRNNVDTIADWLIKQFEKEDIQVEAYHAGLSQEAREKTHLSFLVGTTTVVVR